MNGEGRAIAVERLRVWLMVGVAFISLLAGAAVAQSIPLRPQPPDEAVATDDGLDEDSFYLEADSVIQDDKNKIVTAEGQVEVRYRGRILRAQTLTYAQDTGVVTAMGEVTVINPDGTAQFADQIVLDDDLRAGVALGFSARLQNNIKIASDYLVRRNEEVTELNRAI